MKVVPNLLSIFRICLVPVFFVTYLFDDSDIKFFAIFIYALAGLSDFLDGYIARKFDAHSKLGKLLDPLGDKLMTFTVMICITITRHVLLWAVLVFFVKEILQGIGGLILHKKAKIELPPSNLLGKVSTNVFFAVCLALLFFSWITDPTAIILMSVAIGLGLISLASYMVSYFKLMKSTSKADGDVMESALRTDGQIMESVSEVNENIRSNEEINESASKESNNGENKCNQQSAQDANEIQP